MCPEAGLGSSTPHRAQETGGGHGRGRSPYGAWVHGTGHLYWVPVLHSPGPPGPLGGDRTCGLSSVSEHPGPRSEQVPALLQAQW